jgi:hypothetical protein
VKGILFKALFTLPDGPEVFQMERRVIGKEVLIREIEAQGGEVIKILNID